jgi:hypothetical protein
MIPPKSIRLTAFALLLQVAAGIAAGLGASLPLYGFIGSLGGVFFVWAVVFWISSKRNARYDLNLLREVHDSGGGIDNDLPEVEDDAGVICPSCGTLYGAWMLICPQCKR